MQHFAPRPRAPLSKAVPAVTVWLVSFFLSDWEDTVLQGATSRKEGRKAREIQTVVDLNLPTGYFGFLHTEPNHD